MKIRFFVHERLPLNVQESVYKRNGISKTNKIMEEMVLNFDKTTVRVLIRKDYGVCFHFYTKKGVSLPFCLNEMT